jgi:hypothetical protein
MKQTGFSLASILLLTVVVSIYAGGLRTAVTDPRGVEEELLGMLGVVGLVIGGIVGVTIGGRYGPENRGPAIGLLAGFAFGAPSMILAAVPRSLPVIAVGSLLLIGFAALVRVFSARVPKE